LSSSRLRRLQEKTVKGIEMQKPRGSDTESDQHQSCSVDQGITDGPHTVHKRKPFDTESFIHYNHNEQDRDWKNQLSQKREPSSVIRHLSECADRKQAESDQACSFNDEAKGLETGQAEQREGKRLRLRQFAQSGTGKEGDKCDKHILK